MLEDTPLDTPGTTAQDSPAPADATPAEGAPAEGAARTAKATTKKAATKKAATKKAATKKAGDKKAGDKKAAPKKAASKKAASKKAAPKKAAPTKTADTAAASDQEGTREATDAESGTQPGSGQGTGTKTAAGKKAAPRRAAGKKAAVGNTGPGDTGTGDTGTEDTGDENPTGSSLAAAPLFKAPEASPPRQTEGQTGDGDAAERAGSDERGEESDEDDDAPRRRRRRGGRRRRKAGDTEAEDAGSEEAPERTPESGGDEGEGGTGTRRRRRRRRAGEDGADGSNDSQNTVTKVRQTRSAEDQISSVSGSTRLEAKKQRRREGREAGRRRAPIVSEAEFLARRESVDRVMVIRQREDLTQIGVIEDKVLVEHYVARESQTSLIGNVYLGRVQNVLPSMEAAFVDIGKGRNAVLYAGEVNWSALGHQDGTPRKIESVLSSGQSVLVQVTKDPVGHKGARLTSQISLAGRFLVYVPDGTTSGISRKLPDTERNRLKTLLKDIVPDTAGVIVRTAAEGASEAELTRDVERLKARWEDIEGKAKGKAPALLYGEPDLTLKVVRDLFTEDFSKLVIEGDDAWETVQAYVAHVAPDLEPRLERYETPESGVDVFAAYRVDEQIAKGLDRKVWLPSGGSLIIDRTEAMTVVDVNTGKFTGSGGNLEETVTKNNLEAAEEMVRQLRLRDIGGIIVIDFIDMVLESNRDLVLRRLVECLGRDRTRHQVAEVTSLGLVQMTRKRIGTGLLEAFSHSCETCNGRGVVVHDAPVEPRRVEEEPRRGGRRSRGRGRPGDQAAAPAPKPVPSPKDVAAVARPHEPDAEPSEPPDARAGLTDLAEEPAEAPEPAVVVEEQAVEAAAPPPEPQAEHEAVPEPEPEPEPQAEPAAESEGEPEPAAEAPVTVVTRGRRRSASRPAGPPVVGASVGSALEHGVVEPGTVDVEPGAEPPVEHVPVKRRGARKR